MEITKLDPTNATCRVYTFKEGLLSAVGHDLAFKVETFAVTATAEEVKGTFDLRTLHLLGAVHGGVTTPCDAADRKRIEQSMTDDVLQLRKFPSATVSGTRHENTFSGNLTLHGVTKSLEATATRVGDGSQMVIELVPSQFGIKPFRAMLGALRVEDRVCIELRWSESPS
ncbi:MAG: YceI family protein [Polyangiaceae bacterium]